MIFVKSQVETTALKPVAEDKKVDFFNFNPEFVTGKLERVGLSEEFVHFFLVDLAKEKGMVVVLGEHRVVFNS